MTVFNENNPYGYRLNVNHPQINELYKRYLVWKGLNYGFPISDAERFEFETLVISEIERKGLDAFETQK